MIKQKKTEILFKNIGIKIIVISIILLFVIQTKSQTVQIENNLAYGDYWWTYPCGTSTYPKAQSFVVGSNDVTVTSAEMELMYYSGSGNLSYEIWSNNDNGTPGTFSDDYPNALISNGTSGSIAISSGWSAYGWRNCTYSTSPVLSANTKYWLVAKLTGGALYLGFSTANTSPWDIQENQKYTSCSSWVDYQTTEDIRFRIWGTASAPCSSPSTQASAFTSSSINTTTMTVGWTRGNGNNVMVIARAGSAPSDPTSGTTYTANAAYGSGTAVGGGYCVYNGTGTSVNLTSLTSSTTYYFAIYEYNTASTCYNLTELTGNATTLDCFPSTQATSFSSSSVTSTSMTVSWTRGNGDNVMVVAKAGGAPTDPTTGTTYAANAAYGSGDACGGGFVVYNGTGTNVNITSLTGATTYYFAIYEYNNAGTCYFLTELTGNVTTCNASVSLPQTCDFTSYTGADLSTYFPNFSEASGATPSGTTSSWVSSTSFGTTTTKINLYTTTREEWIICPTFLATANTVITFKAAITDYNSSSADASGMQGTDDKVIVRVKACGGSWTDVYTFQAANTVSLTNSLTDYNVDLSAYNGQNITVAFFASDGPTGDTPDYDFHLDDINIYNACTSPTTQASSFTSSSVTSSTMTVGWTRGNGDNVLVVAKAGSPPTDPSSGVTYAANSAYGSGDACGGGFVVYNGTGTSVNITALSGATTYYFAIYEYFNSGTCYSLSELAGNVKTCPVAVALPQTCDFTSYTGGNLTTLFPNFSEASGVTPSGTTSSWTNSSSLVTTTASINLFSNSNEEWIIGPTFTVANSTLSFKAAITDYNSSSADPDGMQGTDDAVYVRVQLCGGSWTDLYTFDASTTTTLTNSLIQYSLDLSSYNGQDITIAFYATDGSINDSPDYDFHLDDINIVNVTAAPDCETLSSPSNGATGICPGDGTTLSWTPAGTGFAATSYQLYFGTDNPPTNIVNGTNVGNTTSYVTGVLSGNTTYYWRIFPVNVIGTNTTCTTTYSFTTQNISITSTNSPVTTCENTANLTATGSGTINWYTTPTGGSPIATGSPYNATFSGNTTYYVGASNGSTSDYIVGKPGPSTSSFSSSSMGIWFDVLTPLTIKTVDVYVTTAGTNLTVRLDDGSYNDLQTKSFTSLPSGKNTLTLNFAISTTGTYVLISKDGVSLGMDNSASFPYTQAGIISLTSSEWWGALTSEYDYFYNWVVSAGTTCESAREAVNVIHTAPDITITPSGATTFLSGGSVDLTASSTASPSYTYTWSPATGLNTTSGATVTASPTTTTTYTVTGTNGTPCTQTEQVVITVIQPCTGLGTGVTDIASLPYSTTGQTTSGMVNDINNSNAVICGSSNYYTGNDVVYTFTPATSGTITITLTSTGTFTGIMLYDGCPMNGQGGTCVAYSQSSTGNKSICVTVSSGVTYYLIIDSYSAPASNPYDLSITAPDASANLNDLPCDATPINENDLTPGDNTCATSTGEPTAPSCWTNGTINSVWYSLTTGVAQTSIKIRTIVGTLLNTQIAVYSGTCGSGLSYIACNDDAAACGSSSYDNSELTVSVSPSTTYYIVVDGYSDQVGSFSIVWIDGASAWPPVAGQDCSLGVPMCSSTFTVGNPGYQAVGNICDFGTSYCLASGERGSAWYEITINANGNMMFTLEPNDFVQSPLNDGTDYDFGIWKKTGSGAVSCSDISAGTATPLRCNYSYLGVTGLYTSGNSPTTNSYTGHTYPSGTYDAAFESPLAVTSGEVYWLVISNFSNSTSGFTINFTNSTNGFNFTAPNPLIWTGGASSTDWFDPANWGNCSTIPTSTIDCIIASSSAYQPVINANGAVCRSITINSGASLTINSTRNLEIRGNYNNQGTLNAVAGSTVTMTGTAAQTMDGIMVSPSEFASLTINKTAGSVQLNQNIETSSSLVTSSATSVLNTNGNYVIVGGNLTLNSPATYTNCGTTGTLEMKGSSLQTISAGGTLDLCNFTMNNSNGGVNISNDIQLNTSGIFTLTSGIINTSTNNIIVLNTTSTSVSNGSSTSFVNGNLRRYFTSNTNTYAFPVGTGTSYRLAEIINNNLTGITYFDSKFLSSFTSTGALNSSTAVDFGTAYSSIASEGIWHIEPNTSPSGGSYSINLWFDGGGSNSFSGLSDDQFGPVKRPVSSTLASDWTAIGGTLNTASTAGRTVAGGYARRNDWTTFSEYAIAKSPVVLPVTMISINVDCNGEYVTLSWNTASEFNNDYFWIDKSSDLSSWSLLDIIQGAGSSNHEINYSVRDYNLFSNINYYRIKQVDYNGDFTYFPIVSVECESKIYQDINVINSPSSDNIIININNLKGEEISVYLIDNIGRYVSTEKFKIDEDNFSYNISKSKVGLGIYNLVIVTSNSIIPKQIVITRN